jgi:Flp pilus assembly CpaF family ATPase
MSMPNLEPLKIIVRGKHDTGRTTVASLIKMFLEENGFRRVTVKDTEPLPAEEKDRFMNRFMRNRERPVHIIVELEE